MSTFSFNTNTGQPTSSTSNAGNSSNSGNSDNSQGAQGGNFDPSDSPSGRNVNPHSNQQKDQQTNALTELQNMLKLGNDQNSNRDGTQRNDNSPAPDYGRRGSRSIVGANDPTNRTQPSGTEHNPSMRNDQQDNGDPVAGMIGNILHNYRGDPLYQFDDKKISDGLREGNLEPLMEGINGATAAAVNRALEVVLRDISPQLIEAAVSRSVEQASSHISASSVWSEFQEAHPDIAASGGDMVRQQLETAFKNTGDKKKAIAALAAVYGGIVAPKGKSNNNNQSASGAFDFDQFLQAGS